MSENGGPKNLSLAELAGRASGNVPELSHQHRLLLEGFNQIYKLFRSGNLTVRSSNVITYKAFAEITEALEGGTPEARLILDGTAALDFLAAMKRQTTEQKHLALLDIVIRDLQRALKELHVDTGGENIRKHGELIRTKVGDLLKREKKF